MKQNSVKAQTVIRTVVLFAALLNQILALVGRQQLPIYENELVQLLTLAATIVAGIRAWWKNNSFTSEALEADSYLQAVRELNREKGGGEEDDTE